MFRIIKKFQQILNKKQKIRVIVIGIMMVIGAVLETLGVGLVLPLVTAIMDTKIIENNKYAKLVCELFDLHSARTFIIVIIMALIAVFILKNVYLFLEYYVQHRFICNNRFAIQQQLMDNYLQRPYEHFLHVDSGETVRVIISDTGTTFSLLATVLSFFTEAVISMALIITIIITDPLMAFLIAGILGIVMLSINILLKPVLKKAGLSYQMNSGRMNKWLLQSISGIKELKVQRKEDYFLEQFSKYGKRAIESEKINNVLGTVPRLAIEAIGVSAMLSVIALLMFKGREVDTMLPQLSAFAMAAVRLLPSVNRMSAALNTMVYQEPALDKMIENLTVMEKWTVGDKKEKEQHDVAKDTSSNISFIHKIELSNINYTYPGSESPVLLHASMTIPAGKSVGVVGASGSGKTTAIDIILGLLDPQEGQVLADGVDIRENYSQWLSHLGYIPQMIFMLDDSIGANIAFGVPKEKIDDSQMWKVLKEAKLDDFVKSLPEGLDTQIGERGVRLSGGQRQRIGIARALYTDPQLLIFDEATSALDNETEAAIMDSINSLHGKKTMIIIAHRLQTIEGCDIVYRVENGKILKE